MAANGSPISGETASTYVVGAGLLGDTISCNVIASNVFSPPTVTAESNGLVVVEAQPPVNTVAPVLSGTPNPTEVLTCTDGKF